MVTRLRKDGHRVIAYDRDQEAVQQARSEGAIGAASLEAVVTSFESAPRAIWVMLPAGEPTRQTVAQLGNLLQPQDIVIDGGNTNWRETAADAASLAEKGIRYLDAGTSGGVWGLENGYCLMVGGDQSAYECCLPALRTLAPPEGGLIRTGPAGSGHFVKMVHNGVEYALMQAYAEGFQIMKASEKFPELDMHQIAECWRDGSVVRSWLLDLIADGLSRDPHLSSIRGYVDDTGEGRWTVGAAIDEAVPAPTITMALFERFRSRMEDTFADRLLAMMRNQFGGHPVQTANR